jgi:hypothetical protein
LSGKVYLDKIPGFIILKSGPPDKGPGSQRLKMKNKIIEIGGDFTSPSILEISREINGNPVGALAHGLHPQ